MVRCPFWLKVLATLSFPLSFLFPPGGAMAPSGRLVSRLRFSRGLLALLVGPPRPSILQASGATLGVFWPRGGHQGRSPPLGPSGPNIFLRAPGSLLGLKALLFPPYFRCLLHPTRVGGQAADDAQGLGKPLKAPS